MIDLHLINTTLVGLGIGTVVVLVIAAGIIAVAAMRPHRPAARRGHPALAPTAPQAPAHREPALR
jgi:hypothetical protein